MVHVIARLNNGGPVRVLATLADMLVPRGIRFTVLAGTIDDDEEDAAPLVTRRGIAVVTVEGLGRAVAPLRDLRALRRVRRELRRLAPDLVHTHTAKAGFLGRLAAASLGLPCLHTYHGHVLHGYFSRSRALLFRGLEALASRIGRNHALTPGLRHELADRYGLGFPWNWRVLPIPVSPVMPTGAPWADGLDPARPCIGFLGRLAPVKDPLLFLEVVEQVNRHLPVQAVVCGGGELAEAVRRRAATASFPCLVTGFVPAGEALEAMDLMLMTSVNEGLPVGAVEAMLAERPCVAPAVGGLRDLGAGVHLAPRRAEALARRCLALLTDEVLRRRTLAAGLACGRAFLPERLAPAYEALYRRLARGPRAAA